MGNEEPKAPPAPWPGAARQVGPTKAKGRVAPIITIYLPIALL